MRRRRAMSSPGQRPRTAQLPDVGERKPISVRIVVVFPAPFGPRKPNTSPAATLRLNPETAVSEPYRFVRSSNAMGAVRVIGPWIHLLCRASAFGRYFEVGLNSGSTSLARLAT